MPNREIDAPMNEAVTHSPWWYRQRGYVMMALYWASIYASYKVAGTLHLSTMPIAMRYGAAAEHAIFAFGALLAAAGWLLRSWGASYLLPTVVWNHDALQNRLYVAGPFRYSRNPLYTGNLLLAAAIGLFVPPLGWAIVVLCQLLFIEALIREEERGLRARYGAEFDRYCTLVPQLIPRLVPAPADVVPHGDLFAAMRTETLMAGFVLTFVTFAIFGAAAHPWAWSFALLGLLYQYAARTRPL
jgi:protein-S-isoprenylcysteine O-methyltransferase Ste14